MSDSPSTSLLTVLSLYTSLRRSGSTEREAQSKVRSVANQLSGADRQELIKTVNDWESKYGRELMQNAATHGASRATLVMTPDAAQMYGESRYDVRSSTSTDTVLQPLHRIISCPGCGKKNDATKPMCAYCGQALESPVVAQSSDDNAPTWFGPTTRLMLTIPGAAQPLELSVPGLVILGRHTPEDRLADIDLTPYGADHFGVSRLHASLQRQNNRLIVTDMGSKNHTFLNGTLLTNDEVRTLKSWDQLRLGNLACIVTFKDAP
jgi:hypothetical protein